MGLGPSVDLRAPFKPFSARPHGPLACARILSNRIRGRVDTYGKWYKKVSFTAATRSVEPVSTELLSLPARACFTGHRVQQNERLNAMTKYKKVLVPLPTPTPRRRGRGPSCAVLLRNLLLRRPVSTVRGCSLQMPRGECSALPRTVDTGVARYEAFASLNVRRAVCLSVLEQCSKMPRSELCVKWIPALSASYKTQFCTAKQTNLHNETVIMDNH
ncbi:hypothetical protein J6590_001286 [Homalodisca vitripennis]|nr:hypothetical protein J6590_001286 [Homalodisca vitripennis]